MKKEKYNDDISMQDVVDIVNRRMDQSDVLMEAVQSDFQSFGEALDNVAKDVKDLRQEVSRGFAHTEYRIEILEAQMGRKG